MPAKPSESPISHVSLKPEPAFATTIVTPVEGLEMQGDLVCHCHQVSDVAVKSAIREEGATTVDEVTFRTCAGSACYACHVRIERLLTGQELDPCANRFLAIAAEVLGTPPSACPSPGDPA